MRAIVLAPLGTDPGHAPTGSVTRGERVPSPGGRQAQHDDHRPPGAVIRDLREMTSG